MTGGLVVSEVCTSPHFTRFHACFPLLDCSDQHDRNANSRCSGSGDDSECQGVVFILSVRCKRERIWTEEVAMLSHTEVMN